MVKLQMQKQVIEGSMRILLINYHHFIHGGPDRYFFNVKDALEQREHNVIPFSFNYDETLDTPFRRYFPKPITGEGPYLLEEMRLSSWMKISAAGKLFYNSEVNRKFRRIIRMERPDLVFSVYLSSSFLPNILKIAKQEFGLPVVYRLSDFHFFCASYLFCRNGKACMECLQRPWSTVKYRCVHYSLSASILRYLQMRYIRFQGWYNYIDNFICPSKLMAKYLIQNGIGNQKVCHIPTFSKDLGYETYHLPLEPYVLYFGNVVPEKGVEILVRAFNEIKKPSFFLRMVGHVNQSYRMKLMAELDDEHRRLVQISGPEYGGALETTIRQALFIVHPALCFENMPNSVLEAMSAGKPILASNIGSMPEIVKDGVNGRLFQSGSTVDLARTLVSMGNDRYKLSEMGKTARRSYEYMFMETAHMEKLEEVFYAVLAQRVNTVSQPCLEREQTSVKNRQI